ncbi:MAG: MBL fold metallo-hydrolase [Hyphomicrobiaceae bacterium]|nr:MBL fold metallo-hydrolase [Hyphomicrobiaceae bacterium]
MQSISRRGFVFSAAAAAAAFGLDGPLEIISAARAQGAPDLKAKGFAKFKVGDWNVTTIYDGVWERALDANLAKNAPLDEVKAASKAAGYPDSITPITFTVTVAEKNGQIIMFDSGTGGGQAGGPKAGLLAKENLAKAGIDPAKISKILVTHYHGDHIFGLMAKDTNAQVFPNAEIVVPEAEHKYWSAPDLIEKLPEARKGLAKRIQATLPTWKNVKQVAAGAEAAPGIKAINTNGHTPGHTSFELASGTVKLVVSGDVTNVHALFAKNPEWHFVGDQDPELAVKSRRALFEQAVKDGSVLTGYHWGMPGAGTLKKDGNGYVLVPVTAA